jgi:hypothetical protein
LIDKKRKELADAKRNNNFEEDGTEKAKSASVSPMCRDDDKSISAIES